MWILKPRRCAVLGVLGNPRNMLRFARRVSAGAAAGASAYAAYEYNTNEGFRRACQLYFRIGPVVLLYRAVEFKHALLQPPEDVI